MENQMKLDFQTITEKLPDGKNSSAWLKKQQDVADMTARYGNAEKFLNTFKPDMQVMAARYTDACLFRYGSHAGNGLPGVWRVGGHGVYMRSAGRVSTCLSGEREMPVNRSASCRVLVLAEYPYLKVDGIAVVFHRLKCGRYGRFYGMVDALTVTSALMQFMGERLTETNRYKAARKKEEKPENVSSGGITYEEYLQLKAAGYRPGTCCCRTVIRLLLWHGS